MTIRDSKLNQVLVQVIFPALLAIALISTNSRFTLIEDETKILSAATPPVRTTLALFSTGYGQHEHSPLYDILLHFWLRWSGTNLEYLRLPSIFFYCLGLLMLARAAWHVGGRAACISALWLGVLWPFGFHYGRLTTWYGFSFFLVAGLTLAYFRYLEDQNCARWGILFLFCVALIWTNYFGWAILACLIFDQALRRRTSESTVRPDVLFGSAALLYVAFLPLLRAFQHEIRSGVDLHQRFLPALANTLFSIYSLFVSESVAPWFYWLSIPATLSILACITFVVACAPKSAKRFFLFGALLIGEMSIAGILNTRRLLLIAPWVLLPLATAVGAKKPRWADFGMPAALLIIGGIGWFGIVSRHYYSASRFIEPWQQIAETAADGVRDGAVVIADNPSFFFYLGNILQLPDGGIPWKYGRLLPDEAQHGQVQTAEEWKDSGRPIEPKVVWIRGMSDVPVLDQMAETARHLDRTCKQELSRLLVKDEGYALKQRFFPERGQPEWRIEIREYDCTSALK